MSDGAVVGSEAGSARGSVDVLFQLLRVESGTFAFDPNADVLAGKAHDLEPLLAEAQARLAEWQLIEAVVPSLATPVGMAEELSVTKVTVTAAQWRILRAVAGGGTVADVARLLDVDEFHACQAVKRLVDAGLVSVGDGLVDVARDLVLETGDGEDGEDREDDEVLEDPVASHETADDDDEPEIDPEELVSIPDYLRGVRHTRREPERQADEDRPARVDPLAIAAARRRAELAGLEEKDETGDLVDLHSGKDGKHGFGLIFARQQRIGQEIL